MGAVCRGGVGYTTVAAWEEVAKLVGQSLQVIHREFVVIVEDVVMAWLASALQGSKMARVDCETCLSSEGFQNKQMHLIVLRSQLR